MTVQKRNIRVTLIFEHSETILYSIVTIEGEKKVSN